jgi:MFS family permease
VKKVYYGWYVVIIAMVINSLGVGILTGAFGAFVLPISADMQLTRAEVNTGLIFQHVGNVLFAPFIGRLLDRAPTRPIMFACSTAFGLSLVTLGLSHSVWLSAIVMGTGIPIAYLGAGSMTNTVLIARWFAAQRAKAMMLAGTGMSLGMIVVPPIAGVLIESYGWRMALTIIGVATGAILLAFAFIVRVRPGPDDVEVAAAAASAAPAPSQDAGAPMKVGALLRSILFWMLVASMAISVSVSQGIIVSLTPIARASGLSMLESTTLMSVIGAVSIISGLLFSPFADKVNKMTFLASMFLLEGIVSGILLIDTEYVTLLIAASALGVVSGTALHSFYALLADKFGAPSMGTLRGLSMLVFGLFGMVTIRFVGEVFDRTGSYAIVFGVFVAAQALGTVMMYCGRFVRHTPPQT